MFAWIDIGPASMMALEEQPVGGDGPLRSCNGEKLTEDSLVAVSQGTLRRMTSLTKADGWP